MLNTFLHLSVECWMQIFLSYYHTFHQLLFCYIIILHIFIYGNVIIVYKSEFRCYVIALCVSIYVVEKVMQCYSYTSKGTDISGLQAYLTNDNLLWSEKLYYTFCLFIFWMIKGGYSNCDFCLLWFVTKWDPKILNGKFKK
jgi:hypothetical protein